MSLEIQVKKSLEPSRRGSVTLELAGSLDTSTAPQLERGLATILEDRPTDLVFDLAGLSFVSSAGLRVFGMARKRLKENGGQVSFVHMQPQIAEVFEIIRALPGMSIFASMEEFDAYLAARQRRDRDDDD